ncbi:MAG: trypsin-like peptidase domain-containing protein [Oscillospiraceae bacterium]|nr:trypsin-like peptidase domain-containing protein [Oscillospiraceae bacterium]
MKNHNYINKRAKFRTAVAACLGTIIFGGLVGFGGSQILLEIINLADIDSNSGGGLVSEYADRDSWRGVSSTTPRDSSSDDSDTTTVSRPVSGEFTASEIFEKRSNTVVGVRLVRGGFAGETMETDVIGSGVIITNDGFIVTNAHVIEDAINVIVVVDDYEDPTLRHEFDAVVFGYDTPTDLAVLKIERDEPFRYAPIGSSAELSVGQDVVVIGNPVGLHQTMTRGIVSGLQRDLRENPFMLPSIQTDAPVNPGNSGGPLFNMFGEVVGIVNIKLTSSGMGVSLDNLGFAISIDEAMSVIDDLATHGRVASRAMLGISAAQITPANHTMYATDVTSGLYVLSVNPNTPAAASGLSRGDIITHIEGETVASVQDIQTVIRDKTVGDEIELNIVRHDNHGIPSELTIRFALIGGIDEE